MSDEKPIYVSKPHKKSWGQEYRIYEDRIELRAKILFRMLKIKFKDIERLEERGPGIEWSDMYKRPLDFWWIYNNDFGWKSYVFLKQRGWPSRIKFTPEDTSKFVAVYNELCLKK